MTIGPEPLVAAAAAALVILGVLANMVSSRLGVPSLLLFLAIGMLAGSEGFGGIAFDDANVARSVGVVSLSYILFSGGFDTAWRDVRPVARRGVLLATAGVAITAGVSGSFAAWALDLDLRTGLLLGAIISSTDAAAVFAVLRSRNVRLRRRLRALLEFESGSNDPMAAFLTIGLLTLIPQEDTSYLALIPMFVQQMAIGAAAGYLMARLTAAALNRLELEYDGLYPVVTIAAVLLIHGGTTLLGGSGFLAVYIAGLVMGNSRLIHKQSLAHVHDAVAWLAQISMFTLLGLLVFPSRLVDVAPGALLICAVLIVVARPLATILCLIRTPALGFRENALVSWVGLRGAVPIILATFPLVEGVPYASRIFDVVFFIVLTSVLIQGPTIPAVARLLGVEASPTPTRSGGPENGEDRPERRIHSFVVGEEAPVMGRRLLDVGLPAGTVIVLITRGADHLLPQGGTRYWAGDKVLAVAEDAAVPQLEEAFGSVSDRER